MCGLCGVAHPDPAFRMPEPELLAMRDAMIHRLLRLPILGTSALNLYSSRKGIAHHLREELYADPEKVTDSLIDHYWHGAHEAGSRAALAANLA